jgi:hypothetical protein
MLCKKFKAATVISLFAVSLLGQNYYKPGYIINNSNDTLYGFINTKSNQKNHYECRFKTSAEEQVRSFVPIEIKSYRIENGAYLVSKRVFINQESKQVFLNFW